jgi:hypothetical protein
MKNTLLMGAAVLAALGALTHFGGKPLLAQVRAALVRNIDEPGRSPYQSVALNGAFTPGTCSVDFAPVPLNKRLVVEHLSAYVLVGGATSVVLGKLLLASNLAIGPIAFFDATSVGTAQWAASKQMTVYVEPGGVPRLSFTITSNINCTASGSLTGHLIDLTQ